MSKFDEWSRENLKGIAYDRAVAEKVWKAASQQAENFSAELSLLKVQHSELEQSMHLARSTFTNVLSNLQVMIQEDDIDEATELLEVLLGSD